MDDEPKIDYTSPPASPARLKIPLQPVAAPSNPAKEAPIMSVITPFWNTGDVFFETMSCLAAQTFQNFEWIIIDDGSTSPDALNVLEKLEATKLHNLRLIRLKENVGVSAARNQAIRASRGKYIALLDSDDLIEPTALEKWVWYLETHPEEFFVNSKIVHFGALEMLGIHRFDGWQKWLDYNPTNPIGLYRREVFETVGWYDETITKGMEDWDFWIRCLREKVWGYTLNEYLIWYRRRPTHTDRWEDFDGGEKEIKFKDSLIQKYPEVFSLDRNSRYVTTRKIVEYPPILDLRIHAGIEPSHDGKGLLMLLPHMEIGGADWFAIQVAEALKEKGYRITAVTTLPKPGKWYKELEKVVPDCFHLHHFLEPCNFPNFIKHLMETRKIDVVFNSHSAVGYQLLPWMKLHFPDVFFTDYLHVETTDWKSGGYPRYSLNYKQYLDLTMTTSDYLSQWVVDRGGRADRLKTLYICVDGKSLRKEFGDPVKKSSLRASFNVPEDELFIVFAGRMSAQKQPAFLGQILVKLAQRGIKFTALLAGDGELFEELKSVLIEGDVLDKQVRLLGATTHDETLELMAAADVFLLPSEFEGISLAIFEAMALKCAIVASDVGGQRELVTADTGFLFPSDVADPYVDTLARLAHDGELVRALGIAAAERIASGFDLEHFGKHLDELLCGLPLGPQLPKPSHDELVISQTLEAMEANRIEDWGIGLSKKVDWLTDERSINQIKQQIKELKLKVTNLKGMVERRNSKIDSLSKSLKNQDARNTQRKWWRF